MSDKKTAAELRRVADDIGESIDALDALDVLFRHIAAVEAEGVQRSYFDTARAQADAAMREVSDVRTALNAGPDESTVSAAKRVVQGRDDWKARHDQVFAEADRKIDELRRAGKNADAFAHEMAAKAGAAEREAAEKRVAELEAELADVTADRDGLLEDEAEYQSLRKATNGELRAALGPRLWAELWGPELEALGDLFDAKNKAIRDTDTHAHAAGIREGLERAVGCAMEWGETCRDAINRRGLRREDCEFTRLEYQSMAAVDIASAIRAMKEQVK